MPSTSEMPKPPKGSANDNLGPQMMCTIWILLAISTLVVFARVFVKLRTTRRLWWDDHLLILAMIAGYVHAIFVTRSVHNGLGRHMADIQLDKLSDTLRIGFYSFGGAFLSPMFGRLSFCLFLLSIVWSNTRIPRWPIYLFMIVQVLFNVISVILIYAQCGTHLARLWSFDVSVITHKCLNFKIQTYWNYIAGSVNTLTDLFLTVLPAVIVSFSSLTLKSRIGLICLLCLSFVAMIASIKRTVEAKMLSQFTDYTYDLCDYVQWIAIELNIVIIASTIPLLRPLFKKNGLSRVLQKEVTELPGSGYGNSSPSFEKGGSQTRTMSISSEENILSHRHLEPIAITRTVEVSVSYSSEDRSLAHAALIGLPIE
ncbi:hypothetical protein K461DRAFT_323301 [Myriangium duriaei CBS 260.36]|uniref:Rhodopsin domain-containing protein n=1 Tax=Myriangium duriaei CBS 260.36 TaxID=1168546 RepID=A0A9P4IWH6_9PEZI|nr:hypothetical protein K461DRAFT_323301 [Myriangium duriaei CBS 260.36]